MKNVFIYLVAINFLSFVMFGVDKSYAKCNKRRIPERTLFTLAYLGGGLGCLAGMYCWHHKTKHRSFTWGIPAIVIIETALIFWVHIKFLI